MEFDFEKCQTILKSIRNYAFCSSPYKSNYFLFCCNKRVLARVYQLGTSWYIWYEQGSYRIKINSDKPFTKAINILEKEFCK